MAYQFHIYNSKINKRHQVRTHTFPDKLCDTLFAKIGQVVVRYAVFERSRVESIPSF